jgi:hypothetical protein
MRKHARRLVVTALLTLVVAVPALALWGTFPNDKPVKTHLPPSFLAAINGSKRVWGEAGDTGWKFHSAEARTR